MGTIMVGPLLRGYECSRSCRIVTLFFYHVQLFNVDRIRFNHLPASGRSRGSAARQARRLPLSPSACMPTRL